MELKQIILNSMQKLENLNTSLGNDKKNYLRKTIISEESFEYNIRQNHYDLQKVIIGVHGGEPMLMLPESQMADDIAQKLINYNAKSVDILLFMDKFNQKHDANIYDPLIKRNGKFDIKIDKINVWYHYSASTETQRLMKEAKKRKCNTALMVQLNTDLEKRAEVVALSMHANKKKKIDSYVLKVGKHNKFFGEDKFAKHIETSLYGINFNSSIPYDISQLFILGLLGPKLINYFLRRKQKAAGNYYKNISE